MTRGGWWAVLILGGTPAVFVAASYAAGPPTGVVVAVVFAGVCLVLDHRTDGHPSVPLTEVRWDGPDVGEDAEEDGDEDGPDVIDLTAVDDDTGWVVEQVSPGVYVEHPTTGWWQA